MGDQLNTRIRIRRECGNNENTQKMTMEQSISLFANGGIVNMEI
ncbi:MAG: hypothetical protein QF691_11830 [SAR324 cluster bacterium]|nr:hypothetical protein [SAR324 cluster bacterium]